MTIVEAIEYILNDYPEGLTYHEIYSRIIELGLYEFGAKDPKSVVNRMLRIQCLGIDFPSSKPVKRFSIAGYNKKEIKFTLIDYNKNNIQEIFEKNHGDDDEYLPEEKIIAGLEEHLEQTKEQLLYCILNNHPSFFEKLVVDLLLKMGYGYDNDSGITTNGSNDSGIDGIIKEDKLGLDLIYIQAKRYSLTEKVGRPDLQRFVGAMNNVQKGVFITTSSFSKYAQDYVSKQQKNIKLIDGTLLVDFLVKYELGIESIKSFNIYKINTDYFQEL